MKERINLTPGYCRDIKARNKQFFVHDLNCPGLWLRIYPSGFKTWYYHYRPKGRQTTSIKLGRFEMLNPSILLDLCHLVHNLRRCLLLSFFFPSPGLVIVS